MVCRAEYAFLDKEYADDVVESCPLPASSGWESEYLCSQETALLMLSPGGDIVLIATCVNPFDDAPIHELWGLSTISVSLNVCIVLYFSSHTYTIM